MDSIKEILVRTNNVNNDNKSDSINDNNVNAPNEKYSLDRGKFIPNTEESQLAEELAIHFSDPENYAFYY